MFLHRSNRSERLVDRLAEVVRAPLADPLQPEVIVVQSKGMERWLAMELSSRLGVWANAEFPFPRRLLEQVYTTVLGEEKGAAAAFEQRALMWSIGALLPELIDAPAFEPIARYLAADPGARLRIQLAERIARVFDDYAVYRPELLLRWQRGEEQDWEALLWRALVARHGHGHQAVRAERLLAALERAPGAIAGLPARVCLFGIASLPPLYLSVLSALSRHLEIHLFLLSPSREYFAETSVGHPLLRSLGRLGREFQELLEERTQYVEDERDLYVDPASDSLLHALQSDILHLRERGASAHDAACLPIAAGDDSLAIHVCHGPMREVEVLHDQLTALLQDERLQPHEIAVMTPDIEIYAPVIEAVFGQSSGRPPIPYSVADRKSRGTHEVVLAFHALLDALQSRMSAGTVLDLLSFECIRRRFGIDSEQVDTLRAWVEESGVRWGVDAAHRAEVGQPELGDNTWRFGLDRMLLGYAMQGRERALYAAVLPYDPIEGGSAELLGGLAELCERLFGHRRGLGAPAQVRPLCERLSLLLSDMVDASGPSAREHELLRSALGAVADAADAAGFGGEIDLDTLRRQLESTLDEGLPARGLLSRGVTFCQLVPMRSIPFKVVCLIGMNDGVFPGPNPVLGIGRLNGPDRQRGDRSRRDDDRYMFLEALLGARERLIVSYVGRSIRDNAALPPSVLVGELLDAIASGFTPEGEASAADALARRARIEERLCVVHRLHAFSPRYFEAGADEPGASRLFSYSERDCEGARALLPGAPRSDPPLISGPLPPQDELREITLEELTSWVTVPIRSFCQRQLGLFLGEDLAPLSDREPIALEGLPKWQLGTELLRQRLTGADPQLLPAIARARGELPLGTVGALAAEEVLREVDTLARAALRLRGGERLPALPLAVEVDGVRITGTLHGLWPGGQVDASYSKVGRRFELTHFIRHVALNGELARHPRAGYPRRSALVAPTRDRGEIAEVGFAPIEDPDAILRVLLEIVRAARRAPLPFVYEAAREYAERAFDPRRPGLTDGLKRAEDAFGARFGASEDAYVKLFYPTFASLIRVEGPSSFTALAERVFAPFYRNRSVA